jgi:hypothetical protein
MSPLLTSFKRLHPCKSIGLSVVAPLIQSFCGGLRRAKPSSLAANPTGNLKPICCAADLTNPTIESNFVEFESCNAERRHVDLFKLSSSRFQKTKRGSDLTGTVFRQSGKRKQVAWLRFKPRLLHQPCQPLKRGNLTSACVDIQIFEQQRICLPKALSTRLQAKRYSRCDKARSIHLVARRLCVRAPPQEERSGRRHERRRCNEIVRKIAVRHSTSVARVCL